LFAKLRAFLWSIEDRLTVREQIALATAALCLAVSIATAFGAAYVARIEMSRLIGREMSQIAETTSDRIDRYLQSTFHRVGSYASFPYITLAAEYAPERLQILFDQLNSRFPEFNWLAFAGTDGVIRAASERVRLQDVVLEETWFLKGLQAATVELSDGFTALNAQTAGDTDEAFRFIKMSFPVRDAAGKPLGVLIAHIDWRGAEEIRSTMTRDADQIHIVDREGKVLFGPTDTRSAYAAPLMTVIHRTRSGVFQDTGNAGEWLSGYAAIDGYRNFPSLGWSVIARRPAMEALAPVSSLFWTILGLGAVIATIGVLFCGVIARRVAGPILALTRAADRIGREEGISMLPRQRGSVEAVHLSTALRSLLLRLGFVEQLSQAAEAKAAEKAKRFEKDLKRLRQLAETDPLTNLMNRRGFLESAADALRYYRRYERPIATLVIDIDHFKQVNDRNGHSAGDAVIRKVGELVANSLRETDKVARFGGEEFVVLLREVSEHKAHELAERIRETVAATPIEFEGAEMSVTISIGCAAITPGDRDVEELIERADRALYAAKSSGRNCVRLAPPPAALKVRAA
jgi:diguanylate cyclase (GGDEF)-like protein